MTTSAPLPRRLILRTGNLMSSGIGRNYATFAYNSSAELLAGLKEEFTNAKQLSPSSWTKVDSTGTVFAPGTLASGHIKEDRASYDITVKLFYLPSVPPAARAEHTEEAVRLVLDELGTDRIDLLNVSFPGVYFDANDETPDEDTNDSNQNTEERAASDPDQAEEDDEETKSFLHTYRVLEKLVHEGKVGKIGLSEFGTRRLRRLLRGLEREAKSPGFPTTERIKPKVVQINVRDCCVVPRELILYARKEGIQLYTHNDCAEILTREGIEGVVEEGGIWNPWNQDKDVEMSGVGADADAPSPGKRKRDEHSRWGLFPQWVIKYHAVVSDRSIIENKGYIATAEVR